MHTFSTDDWALILGGSSGFGLAAAKKLAAAGMGIVVIHRDLRAAMTQVDQDFQMIRENGGRLVSWNGNALDEQGKKHVMALIRESLGATGRVKVVLHSIAQGNLKLATELHDEDFAQTIFAMGTSLFSYVRELHHATLFAKDARVLSLTSEGSTIALPGYGAVSAAKAALEAVSRSIAAELAPFGIRCNVIQAGVTDTPALRRIPGSERMKEFARMRNPFKRLTTPEDVASFIYLMTLPEASWVNGAVLRVDGGESITLPA